ncbi:ATP synthase membrane subunit K, mitochondrial [Eublepharis macularius]|uniref:ATP synthase membrane subunit K, mitochondrial n=1 Tax=Eublepharis macularius TaxID=481883 RepID=A0AA97JJV9_EUBMA|nr:ATP synthase membrane subunit K, mitochondrial [Eublepharis macularius]XP_054839574.1 ATP synthase membrane subunit K, mitochondrial [Eublepharis macularius]
MAGPESDSHHQFTGIQKYFNSYTMTGRRNCVVATYASIAMIIMYFKLRPKKQTPAVTQK